MKQRPTVSTFAGFILLCGCALTSKSDSMSIRYFTPEKAASEIHASNDPRKAKLLELRIGSVRSATYLKEKIAFRDSEREVGYYDTMRWTEKPEAYVRRSANRALFEVFLIRQAVSGAAPTLDLDLTSFDEIRLPRHAARITITWILRDDQWVIRQQTVTVEKVIQESKTEESASALAASMSLALDEAVASMAQGVIAELSK